MSFASRDEPRVGGPARHVELLVVADHNILWFGEELAGEEGFEPSIS